MTTDIDTRLDEILGADIYVKLNDRTPAKIIVTDSIGTHGYHRTYNNVKQAIKQLMTDEFEKMIGEDTYDERDDHDTLRRQLRQKLEEWKQ